MLKKIIVLAICLIGSAYVFSQERISFKEEEGLVFKPALLKLLGAEKISISAGAYEINFNKENPNGIIVFNLKDYDGPKEGIQSSEAIGIRIAVRYRVCGTTKAHCVCGIGFRCGTTSLSEDGGDGVDDMDDFLMEKGDPRVAAILIDVNPEAKTVTFRFRDALNWELLK
jgi:hypothetical protein